MGKIKHWEQTADGKRFVTDWKRTSELRWYNGVLEQKWKRKVEHIGYGSSDIEDEVRWISVPDYNYTSKD